MFLLFDEIRATDLGTEDLVSFVVQDAVDVPGHVGRECTRMQQEYLQNRWRTFGELP